MEGEFSFVYEWLPHAGGALYPHRVDSHRPPRRLCKVQTLRADRFVMIARCVTNQYQSPMQARFAGFLVLVLLGVPTVSPARPLPRANEAPVSTIRANGRLAKLLGAYVEHDLLYRRFPRAEAEQSCPVAVVNVFPQLLRRGIELLGYLPGWMGGDSIRRLTPALMTDVYLVTEPSVVQELLVDVHNTVERPFSGVAPMLGPNSLLTLQTGGEEGQRWRQIRQVAAKYFGAQYVTRHVDRFQALARSTAWDLRAAILERPLLPHADEYINRFFIATILEVYYGVTLPGEDMREVSHLLDAPYPIPPAEMRRIRERLLAFARKVVEARGDRGTGDDGNLLDALLRKARESDLPMEWVYDQVIIFILTQETTKHQITWALYYLGKHREAARLIRQEYRANRARLADAEQFPISVDFMKEVMRVQPPVPFMPRHAIQTFRVADDFEIPAGAWIILSPWVSHRSVRNWGPTAAEFDPNRFRELRARDERPPRGAYFPWGGGARICVGKTLAEYEFTILLGEILDLIDVRSSTQQPKQGLSGPLKVTEFTLGALPY